MFRRCILQVASRTSVNKIPLRTTTQLPSYLSSRRDFSVSQKNQPQKPHPNSKVPEPKSILPIIIAGGFLMGSFFAYYYGGLDKYIAEKQQTVGDYKKSWIDDKYTESSEKNAVYQATEPSKTFFEDSSQSSDVSTSNTDYAERDVVAHPELSTPEDSIKTEVGSKFQEKDASAPTEKNVDQFQERDMSNVLQSSIPLDHETSKPDEESSDLESSEVKPNEEQNKKIETTVTTPILTSADESSTETEIKSVPSEQIASPDVQKVVQGDGSQKSSPLLDDYLLSENSEEPAAASSNKDKDIISMVEDSFDGSRSKDGKLVLDFLDAIHAAEDRQAELDFRFFDREKRAMKEKYEKELKDSRARELMYAERETILDKELIKERVKAAAALKSLEEKLEEELRTEIEKKEIETEQKLKKMQDIAKAELAAAIASEKAYQIEKLAEANLHINALCMAFYARSEEARQSYSIHKLALGALSLEDALSKGLPIPQEVRALHTHLEGIDKDSLIPLVLSSLPEETQKYGADTLPQLNHKFDALKETLRHFSLMPPGGGGILAHSVAHVASWLKIKEVDQSGDGIESIINKVERLLAQEKLVEAADVLENGVKGSLAAEVVRDWVERVRNRAITDQALTVLQSYATSVSLA